MPPHDDAPDAPQRVSVIIPHYNDVAGLTICLAALAKQSRPPSEIVVCDNNSPGGLPAIETHRDNDPAPHPHGRVRLVLESTKGAAAARNTAVRHATGSILAFLDSDCVPDPGWLEAGCAALESADLVGGAMILSFRDPQRRTNVEAFEAQFAFPNQRYIEQEHFSVTANLFVTKDVFERVGPFRPNVPEDKDWGQRAYKLGLRWAFAPNAKVIHPARQNWNELSGKWRRLTREAYGYKPQRARFLLRSYLVLASSPAYLAPLIWSKRLQNTRERLDVALLVLRLRLWRLGEAHRLVLRGQAGTKTTPAP